MSILIALCLFGVLLCLSVGLWFAAKCLLAIWKPDESGLIAAFRSRRRTVRRSMWKQAQASSQLCDRWLALGFMFLALAAAVMDVMVNYSRLPVVFSIGEQEGLLLAAILPILAAGAGLVLHAAFLAGKDQVADPGVVGTVVPSPFSSERSAPLADPAMQSVSDALSPRATSIFAAAFAIGLFLSVWLALAVPGSGNLPVGMAWLFGGGLALLLRNRYRIPGRRAARTARRSALRPIPLIIALVLLGCNMGLQGYANYCAVHIMLGERDQVATEDAGLPADRDAAGSVPAPAERSAADPLTHLPWAFAMLAAVLAMSETAFAFYFKHHFLAWRCATLRLEAQIQEEISADEAQMRRARTRQLGAMGEQIRSVPRRVRRLVLESAANRKEQRELKEQIIRFGSQTERLQAVVKLLAAKPEDWMAVESRKHVVHALTELERDFVKLGREYVQNRDLDNAEKLLIRSIEMRFKVRSEFQKSFDGPPVDEGLQSDLQKVLDLLKAEHADAEARFLNKDVAALAKAVSCHERIARQVPPQPLNSTSAICLTQKEETTS